MDESQEFSGDEEVAPTPYLGGEVQFHFATSFAHKQPSPQHLDSPIDELNCVANPSLFPQNNSLESFSSYTESGPQLWEDISKCCCRRARLKRNAVVSKVMEVKLTPESDQKNSFNFTASKKAYSYKPTVDRKGKDPESSDHRPQNAK
jgi:hypothetical protein